MDISTARRRIPLSSTQPRQEHSYVTVDDDIHMSCLHHTLQLISNIHHIGLILWGLSGLIYGILISCHLPDPQRAMGSIVEIYSVVLLLAGILGALGTYYTSCHRLPLKFSYRFATIIGIFNIIIFFLLLIEKPSFLRYINQKQTELYLSSDAVEYIERHFNAVYYILFLFTIAETVRYYLDRRLYTRYQIFDQGVRHEMQYRRSRDAQESRRRWENNALDYQTHNDDDGENRALATPLLLDHGSKTEKKSEHQNPQSNNMSWWEEDCPDDAQRDDANLSVISTSSSSGWRLSSLFFKSKETDKSNSSHVPSTVQRDGDEESVDTIHRVVEHDSMDGFDNLDGDMILPDTDVLQMPNDSNHIS